MHTNILYTRAPLVYYILYRYIVIYYVLQHNNATTLSKNRDDTAAVCGCSGRRISDVPDKSAIVVELHQTVFQ